MTVYIAEDFTPDYLRRTLRPGDLCLTLGAGDLTSLPAEFLSEEAG